MSELLHTIDFTKSNLILIPDYKTSFKILQKVFLLWDLSSVIKSLDSFLNHHSNLHSPSSFFSSTPFGFLTFIQFHEKLCRPLWSNPYQPITLKWSELVLTTLLNYLLHFLRYPPLLTFKTSSGKVSPFWSIHMKNLLLFLWSSLVSKTPIGFSVIINRLSSLKPRKGKR